MTYDEFIAVVTAKTPTLEDYRRAVGFVESASIEDLWTALTTTGIHWIFVAVINKALQEKVAQANLDASRSNISQKIKSRSPGS